MQKGDPVMAKVVVRIIDIDGNETKMEFPATRTVMLSCKKIIELYVEKMFQETIKEIIIKVKK